MYNKKTIKPTGIIDYFINKNCEKNGKNIKGIQIDINKGLLDLTNL